MVLTPIGAQATRALSEITVDELAGLASVNHMSVIRFERGENVIESTIEKLKNALEACRITIDKKPFRVEIQNGGRPVARLIRKRS